MITLTYAKKFLATLALTLCGLTAAQADVVYHVTVDTSALSGSEGYLDLQFNPADGSAADATALLSGFDGSITLLSGAVIEGDVSGALPDSVLFINSTAYNDVFQPVSFGDSFEFELSFSGEFLAAIGSDGTSFALSLYAADAVTPLLTIDPNGSVLTFELTSGGIVTAATFDADAAGAAPVATVTPVPLPAALWLLVSGLGILPVFRSAPLRRAG